MKEYDFSNTKPVPEIPALAKLQAEHASGSAVISLRIPNPILDAIKRKAGGKGYQTLINKMLEEALLADKLDATIRQAIREELAK